ncbi:MAG: sensor histidine kinase [Deltaproteobacteria bacterium]|nr:sensor histidine kinase [Deltaproteobacteria bacterium]
MRVARCLHVVAVAEVCVERQHLVTFRIRRNTDVAQARERTRAAAEALGIFRDDAIRAATAASEIARAIVSKGGSGEVAIEVVLGKQPGLALRFRSDRMLYYSHEVSWDPLRAARMLADVFEDRAEGGIHEILLIKHAPAGDLRERVPAAREALVEKDAGDSSSVIKAQNRELVRLLDELRRRGRELERMNDELRRANNSATATMLHLSELARRKDELSAAIAHDLRSPLAAVKGAIDLLVGGVAGEITDEQRRYLEIAERAASHILELVSDLLDSSLLDAGLAQLDLTVLRLTQVVQEVSTTVAFLAREKGIGFLIDIPPELPPLRCDRHKLGQILTNLLTNAVKFTNAGGLVTLRAQPGDGQMVAVEVSDTGIGIAPSRVAELFDKFRRSHSRGTRGERGTGLGLHICRHLVEMHGGTIGVESELGHGTTFRFTIPTHSEHALQRVSP